MYIETQLRKREKYYFNQGYARVVIYLSNHSDANEAKDYLCQDGFYLKPWFEYFREKWKRNELDSKTVYRLELLGITMVDKDDGFYLMLQKYKDYIADNKTSEIPMNYRTEDGCMLGAWLNRQKMCYHMMPIERQKIIKESGII